MKHERKCGIRLADMTRSQMAVRIMRLQQELDTEREEVERMRRQLKRLQWQMDRYSDARERMEQMSDGDIDRLIEEGE